MYKYISIYPNRANNRVVCFATPPQKNRKNYKSVMIICIFENSIFIKKPTR